MNFVGVLTDPPDGTANPLLLFVPKLFTSRGGKEVWGVEIFPDKIVFSGLVKLKLELSKLPPPKICIPVAKGCELDVLKLGFV